MSAGAAPWPRPSRVVVDLGRLGANVAALAAAVRPAALWVVVKADAYGHGALAVARTALRVGAQGLCVALPQEALSLRADGVLGPLLVLGPADVVEMERLGRARVCVTVPDGEALVRARRAAEALPVEARPLAVHLKVDTGMGRIGCPPEVAPTLARAIVESGGLSLAGVFTHFASADEDVAATGRQLARFLGARAAVEVALEGRARPLWHAANSAAALSLPETRLDVVRAGIAVYGYPALPAGSAASVPLVPALSVESRVSFVKRVPAGFAVSYGSTHRTQGERVLATLPLGYADGLRRGLSGLVVRVAGLRVPIVGRVTMDQVVVEGPADWEVQYGDEATLLAADGEGPDALAWAERLGTIAYEVLTGLSPRLPRIYDGVSPSRAEARST